MKRALIVVAMAFGASCAPADAQPPKDLQLPSSQLTDGQKVQFTPITITNSKAERDSRPMVLGGGVVVLAAIFWWNRKRRERFDSSDAPGVAAPRAETDTDADDLQAAARGDNETETKDQA